MKNFLETLQTELKKQENQRDTIKENFSSANPFGHLVDPTTTVKNLLEFERVNTAISVLQYAISVYERENNRKLEGK